MKKKATQCQDSKIGIEKTVVVMRTTSRIKMSRVGIETMIDSKKVRPGRKGSKYQYPNGKRKTPIPIPIYMIVIMKRKQHYDCEEEELK